MGRRNTRAPAVYRVGEYMRLSVEDERRERESNSITSQRQLLNAYIDAHPDMILVREYIDDGATGTNFNREGFKELLHDAETGIINCIIVKDLSRFGRDHIETETYILKIFKCMGVRFIAVTDNYDSLVSGYDMLFSIRNLFNEHYAHDISKKCQASFKAKQMQGEFVGAFPSYGYTKSSTDKHKLEIDPYAAEIIKRIYDLYIRGVGKVRIASILNDEGVLCPVAYKKANGENYRNSKKLEGTCYWTYSTINKILKNEIYTGTMVQGKGKREMNQKPQLLDESEWIKVENTHPAIISREQWSRVQKLLKQRTTTICFEQNQSIFAGFLKCGDCGRAMVKKNHKNSRGIHYYTFQCGTYVRTGNKFCTSHYIKEDVITEIVLNDLNQIIRHVSGLVEMYEQAKEECRKSYKTEMYDARIAKNEIALERVRQLKKHVFEEYALGNISGDEYADYRENYVVEEENLATEKQELLKKKSEIENGLITDWPWVTEILAKKQVKELTRDIVVEMIDSILIYENKHIKIVYNFSGEYEELMKKITGE